MNVALDDESEPIPRGYYVTCPLPPGYQKGAIAVRGWRQVLGLALSLDCEEYAYREADAPAGSFRGFFWLATPEQLATLKEHPKPEYEFRKVRDMLSASDYAHYKERAAIAREDRAYGECKALVLDIDASTADPARAQACANTMAVIDRTRAQRQAEADRRQQAEDRRQQMEFMHAEMEANRRIQQEEIERQRRRDRAEALRRAFQPSAPQPQPTETRCRPNYLGGFDCQTR